MTTVDYSKLKGMDCEKCGAEIGGEPFLVAQDGINNKIVTFHKRCDPTDPDLRRHHMAELAPVKFGLNPQRIG